MIIDDITFGKLQLKDKIPEHLRNEEVNKLLDLWWATCSDKFDWDLRRGDLEIQIVTGIG